MFYRRLFHYTADNGYPGVCELSYFVNKTCSVAVLTDEDAGPSVTNNVETIVKQLKAHGLDPDFWVEHYRGKRVTGIPDRLGNDETWDFVNVDAKDTSWIPASRENVEILIGMPYPD